MWKSLFEFFNQPTFVIAGGVLTMLSLLGLAITIFLVLLGILPVWIRLGLGLANRRITIFADTEFESLKSLLVDSGMFRPRNIIRADRQSMKKAQSATLLLVHYRPFAAQLREILSLKRGNAALIVYAPQAEGLLDPETVDSINNEQNSTIVNLRGRLLNDVLTSMITTAYG